MNMLLFWALVPSIWLRSNLSPLLIFRGTRDLRKPHYVSHVSNPMHQPMKMVIAKIWKCNLIALNAIEQSDLPSTYLLYHYIFMI
jgi:hypothetical protein